MMPDAVAALRRAAAQMRATATNAYPGPWISDDDENCWRLHSEPDPKWPTAQILKAPKHGTPYAEYWPDVPTAAHITTWHPGVALVVADMLDAAASDFEWVDRHNAIDPDNDGRTRVMPHHLAVAALKIARAYLGEADA